MIFSIRTPQTHNLSVIFVKNFPEEFDVFRNASFNFLSNTFVVEKIKYNVNFRLPPVSGKTKNFCSPAKNISLYKIQKNREILKFYEAIPYFSNNVTSLEFFLFFSFLYSHPLL